MHFILSYHDQLFKKWDLLSCAWKELGGGFSVYHGMVNVIVPHIVTHGIQKRKVGFLLLLNIPRTYCATVDMDYINREVDFLYFHWPMTRTLMAVEFREVHFSLFFLNSFLPLTRKTPALDTRRTTAVYILFYIPPSSWSVLSWQADDLEALFPWLWPHYEGEYILGGYVGFCAENEGLKKVFEVCHGTLRLICKLFCYYDHYVYLTHWGVCIWKIKYSRKRTAAF